MRPGIGLYRHMLNDEHFAFARQVGASDVVVHIVDYHYQGSAANPRDNQPVGGREGWGVAGHSDDMWTVEALSQLRERIEAHGLRLAAIENLDPAHWHDVLLDGPLKNQQLEHIKQIVRNMGEAGIPTLGYNFSLAGVASRQMEPVARGGAVSVCMNEVDQSPVPAGMVWNMWYDLSQQESGRINEAAAVDHEVLWQRLADFLNAVLPVAQEAGVTLAAHPDDPPAPVVRSTPRLVYQPHLYQRLIDINPLQNNQLEFCVGTIAEMTEGDIYDAVEQYAADGRLAYLHLRNVRGKVPHYRETFIDDGDVDVKKLLAILKKHDFSGVMIPDHTPQMSCPGSWYAGMAYAMGYMKALLTQYA